VRFALVLLFATCANAAAQPPALAVLDPMLDLSAVPARPPLAALATLDSNDAHEYYDVGMASVDTNQALAAAAFYWASRLDPSWAEAYYARWYVLRRAEPRAISDSVQYLVDSLREEALVHDPFVDEQISLEGRANRLISRWYFAYSGRRYDMASQELAKLIPKYPNVLNVYIYRAKATYYLGQYDTTAAILQSAIDRITAWDTLHLRRRYLPRTVFTYAMGLAYERGHRDSAARAAFQLTLTENLGFYMAHVHLARASLAAHDTATAIAEARLAAEIRPDDPVVQLFLGETLLDAGHAGEAVAPLRAAIASDPYFALPYYYLGRSYETVHDATGAIAGYRGYLARAKRRDPLRERAAQAIALLGGAK
jgi:tetratricopeptide (TPR) repeat protein